MLRQEDIKEVPNIGDKVSVPGSYVGQQERITGTVVDAYGLKRYYVLEFEGKAGKYRMAFKPGGQDRTDHRPSPHPVFFKRKPIKKEKV